jgi:hypothetical protein
VIRRVILALGNGLRDAPSTGGKPLEARQEWDVMRRATLLVTRSRSISIPNFRRISHQDQKIGILS